MWGDECVNFIVAITSQCTYINIYMKLLCHTLYYKILFNFYFNKAGGKNVTFLSSKSHCPLILYSFPGFSCPKVNILGHGLEMPRCHCWCDPRHGDFSLFMNGLPVLLRYNWQRTLYKFKVYRCNDLIYIYCEMLRWSVS